MKTVVDAAGSYLNGGPRYTVFQGRGNLFHRQMQANSVRCCCYVEQHMNAIGRKVIGHDEDGPIYGAVPTVNYALALLPENASVENKAWARSYTAKVAATFGIPDRGLLIGPSRGGYNIRYARCPAMLVEPGFISDAGFAARARSGEGIDALARCLVESIVEHFPDGVIGLSVGHGYRDKPDPGAPVNEDGLEDPAFDSETELNDAIIATTEEMLLAIPGALT